MIYLNTASYLLVENLIFFVVATAFCWVVGLAWKNCKPFNLPEPLPGWFKIWFGTVQIVGVLVPLIVMLLWGVWWGYSSVLIVFLSYFLILGLQIGSEILTLRKFHTVVWVMVPYLYLPYRIWQLYEGINIINTENDLILIRYLLVTEIVLWTVNYALDLSQLPRLFRWEVEEKKDLVSE